jgi:hypothetical protein
MKIKTVALNNRRKAFEVGTSSGRFAFPYSKAEPPPSASDPITKVFVDPELANEGLTYVLCSGAEGSVLLEQFLDYNEDPAYLRKVTLYKLTIEAQKRAERSRLSKREMIRRLGTSPAQLYRLLDQTNHRKSIDQMLALLRVLDCDVEFVVRDRAA